MEPSIYSFSLCTALPLMLFFGFYFLFAKTPEKKIFKNYLRSRQIMGIALCCCFQQTIRYIFSLVSDSKMRILPY